MVAEPSRRLIDWPRFVGGPCDRQPVDWDALDPSVRTVAEPSDVYTPVEVAFGADAVRVMVHLEGAESVEVDGARKALGQLLEAALLGCGHLSSGDPLDLDPLGPLG